MLGDFASLDVQNTYRGSDAYVLKSHLVIKLKSLSRHVGQLKSITGN
ncbi:hypothetical protein [Piscirickettsia salmonis]|nr:hypothetical protein [Piscirickettsia salmonis]